MAGPAPPDNLFSVFSGSATQLLILVGIIPVAMVVFWYGSRAFRSQRGTAALRPQGRFSRPFGGGPTRDAQWRRTIARLEGRPPTPTAQAKLGPVRVEGVIVRASGYLGGRPGRECVWRNRAGGRPQSAVGAEIIVIRDDSGLCGVDGVEQAQVIAPAEKHSQHHENVSLYVGDRVEVYGEFDPEDAVATDDGPTEVVYGTVSHPGGLEVRLLQRPPSDAQAEPSTHPS